MLCKGVDKSCETEASIGHRISCSRTLGQRTLGHKGDLNDVLCQYILGRVTLETVRKKATSPLGKVLWELACASMISLRRDVMLSEAYALVGEQVANVPST